ncbi:MAG TPA: DUF2950 family protein [Terriglobales bacterium]|nr:DUF2950 family protein [Terriglobales bacterium]
MRTNLIPNANRSQTVARRLLVNLAASLILTMAQPALAQMQQKTFASPEQASQALYDAVRNKDDQGVQAILGAAELTSTGNDDEDKLEREHFARKYDEMHRLVREPDGSTVLYVGAENWPFPIPLVESDSNWHFDSDSGSQEIIARQVGENETAVIEVCQATKKVNGADAGKAANDPVLEFAEKIVKSDSASPRNELFHGYYFRTASGRRGERLVVAYPAEYRASGVMTFIVTGDAVYEKDLGPQSATIAQKIQGKPKGKWTAVHNNYGD